MSCSKNLDGLFASQSEFVAHLDDFAVAKMDFDEFRTANRSAVFVLESCDYFFRPRVDYVRRMRPGIPAVEAKTNPAVTALA